MKIDGTTHHTDSYSFDDRGRVTATVSLRDFESEENLGLTTVRWTNGGAWAVNIYDPDRMQSLVSSSCRSYGVKWIEKLRDRASFD